MSNPTQPSISEEITEVCQQFHTVAQRLALTPQQCLLAYTMLAAHNEALICEPLDVADQRDLHYDTTKLIRRCREGAHAILALRITPAQAAVEVETLRQQYIAAQVAQMERDLTNGDNLDNVVRGYVTHVASLLSYSRLHSEIEYINNEENDGPHDTEADTATKAETTAGS